MNKHRVENVRLLIEAGADLDHKDSLGIRPLDKACGAGVGESFVDLLNAGADPTKTNDRGESVLELWFVGRDDNDSADPQEIPWFRKAGNMLIERGLLVRDSEGKYRLAPRASR